MSALVTTEGGETFSRTWAGVSGKLQTHPRTVTDARLRCGASTGGPGAAGGNQTGGNLNACTHKHTHKRTSHTLTHTQWCLCWAKVWKSYREVGLTESPRDLVKDSGA